MLKFLVNALVRDIEMIYGLDDDQIGLRDSIHFILCGDNESSQSSLFEIRLLVTGNALITSEDMRIILSRIESTSQGIMTFSDISDLAKISGSIHEVKAKVTTMLSKNILKQVLKEVISSDINSENTQLDVSTIVPIPSDRKH